MVKYRGWLLYLSEYLETVAADSCVEVINLVVHPGIRWSEAELASSSLRHLFNELHAVFGVVHPVDSLVAMGYLCTG